MKIDDVLARNGLSFGEDFIRRCRSLLDFEDSFGYTLLEDDESCEQVNGNEILFQKGQHRILIRAEEL